MQISRFEDILSWQKARELTKEIYKSLQDNKDYSFRDQIQRASVSVMNNIAEGYERHTNKDFMNFLYIAKGSCGEVRSMLVLGKELGYFKQKKYDLYYNMTIEISKLLSGFITSLRT